MNILLISSIYPIPENNHGTFVCHFFAKEWLKMGHNVRVVHNQASYPIPLYWMPRLFRQKIVAKTGAVVYTKKIKDAKYEMNGVPIMRVSMFKPVPHGKYVRAAIKKTVKKTTQWLENDGFKPDIIVGHFPNPQIEVVGCLKSVWPDAISAIVMHGDTAVAINVYGNSLQQLSEKIDVWGFRSVAVKKEFEELFKPVGRSFICYSGIPEKYIAKNNSRGFIEPLHNFVYVGDLIERKYPIEVMDALMKAYPKGDFRLTYVGAGALKSEINAKSKLYNIVDRVSTPGKIPRDNIIEKYDKSDCMIMISRGEAYGLVYLEAMARGCITIASRNEGIDGVIVDGENGFLCKAGDSDELASIIIRINSLTPEKRKDISKKAIETARGLTDFKAAERYITDLLNSSKK